MYEDSELNRMQEFIDEYEDLHETLEDLIGHKGYKHWLSTEIVEGMICFLEEEGKKTYEEYKDILEEEENNDKDFVNNDGIWESVMRERRTGFYGL